MGPKKTAITLTGGPRVISVFDVHGCHRVQIKHFFGMQTGSRTPYGLGLMVGSRLHRMRRCLRLPESFEVETLQLLPDALSWRCILVDVSEARSAHVCGIGDCIRLVPTLSDPRETSGPRIDRIPPARLTKCLSTANQEINFSAPNKCPIDQFGTVSNRTIRKQMYVAFPVLVKSTRRVSRSPSKKVGRTV